MLIMLITAIVQSSYTQSHNTLRIDHDILLAGSTYFTVAAFLPIPIVTLSIVSRHIPLLNSRKQPTEKFGTGRFRTKIAVILISSSLICLGACFRCIGGWLPRPQTDPAWFDSRAVFYCFNFVVEITVVYMYAFVRVDRRFHIPNGANGPGSYNARVEGAETPDSGNKGEPKSTIPLFRVQTEEEFEADFVPPGLREEDSEMRDVEKGDRNDRGF